LLNRPIHWKISGPTFVENFMANLVSLVANIIVELTLIHSGAKPVTAKDDPFPLPRMIGTANGGGIIVSREVDDLIVSISRELKSYDPGLGRRVQDNEWNRVVRAAFGPALAAIDLSADLQINARSVLDDVKAAIANSMSAYGQREHAFACTLFSNEISPFSIGPARFEPRRQWLQRKFDEGGISTTSYQRIKKAWDGTRLGKRKPSIDSTREDDVLATIGNAPYVCSISTDGFASEAGTEKALTAARVALTSIALLWQTPSRALEGLNLSYDRTLHRRKTLSFVPGQIVLSSSQLSHMPHGPHLKAGEWEQMLAERFDHFETAAEILEYFVSPTGVVARPKLMNTLGQALLWFHEGCRETVTLMAIVKFSASMDALGGGHKAGGIRKVITARLGLKDDDPIRKNGPTMKNSIERIYGQGRSQTVHGTNNKLGHDWSSMRTVAEQFARICLISCIDWAANNPTADDPALLQK